MCHRFCIHQFPIKFDMRKFNFTNRVISVWNTLPDTVVSANTIDTFKARLGRLCSDKEVKYNWKSDIITRSRSQVSVIKECLFIVYPLFSWYQTCKGDEASQWRNPKFDPSPRSNPVSDRNTNRHTWLRRGPLHQSCAKVRHDPPRRFVSAHAWLCTPKRVTFFGFLQLATVNDRGRILTQNAPKHAVPPKDVPFRGREHKI